MTESVPSYVIQNIEARKVEKQAKDLKDQTNAATVEYFRSGGKFENVSFSDSKTEKINMDVITKWVFENQREFYDRLFTRVPDPNGFAELVQQGVIDESKLPPNYKEVITTPRITVKAK